MLNEFDAIIDLLRNDGSVIANKNLAFEIGMKETIVFSELLSKYRYFKQEKMLTADGYFFNTIDNFRLDTTYTGKQQRRAINKLEDLNLIKTDLRGLPPKRYFKPTQDTSLVLKYINNGAEKRKELKEKLAEKADISKNRYNGRINTSEKAETNVPKRSVNNTNKRILNNNTKTNAFSQGKSVCLDTADEKLNIIFEIYNLLHYFAVKRKELGYETKFTISKWNEYAKKFSQQYSYETSYDKAITFEIDSELIDAYFNRNFSRDIDYNIPHFLQREVLINTYKQIMRE